jgi:protoporphyrinogen oxidase
MRKLSVLLLIGFVVSHQPLKAQYYYYNNRFYDNPVVFEIGLTGGVMNSMTDLGGKAGIGKNFIKDLRWKTARPSL